MMEMDHPNVLTLTGVCLDGGPAPYIILPFMANGSLLSYLKKERDSLTLNAFTEDVSAVTCNIFHFQKNTPISGCCLYDCENINIIL